MRRALLAVTALSLVACAPRRIKQSTVVPATLPAGLGCASNAAAKPYFVLDGVASTCEAVNKIPISRIASVEVIKGQAALDQYGSRASGGVIFVNTKP